MLILEAAITVFLLFDKVVPKPPAPPRPPINLGGAELAKTIKSDIESIAGPGSVEISIDHETLFSVRIAVPNFDASVCDPVFDRELKLYRLFPDYNFDFYLRLKSSDRARH